MTHKSDHDPIYSFGDIVIFTALHEMQTRSVCLSVRPSVCLSHARSLTKWKKDRSRFLYHTKEHLA